MNAPTPLNAPPTLLAAAPSSHPAPPSSRASASTNAAAAAIARSEALAASRQSPAKLAPLPTAPAAGPKPTASVPAAPAPGEALAEHPWRTFFSEWPSQIPKRGILITKLNEASPFKAFMMRGDFLLLERVSPDSLGGRFIVIPFEEISTVKFTDPLKQPALEAAGFAGQLSQ
ncbi:hypothetical protein [Botrimarina mediterranea]